MGLIAEYEMGCEALPLTDVARAVPAATLTVRMVPHAEGHSPFVVRVIEGPAADVEAAFETSDFVAEYTALGVEVETPRYQVIPAPSLEEQLGDHVDDVRGLRALSAEDAAFDRLEVRTGGWRLHRLVRRPRHVRRVLRVLAGRGSSLPAPATHPRRRRRRERDRR